MNLPPFPIIVLAAVLVAIAVRQVGRFRFRIWQIMAGGAVVLILTGQISIPDSVAAVSMPVMVFLFSMFVLGESFQRSGYLSVLSSFAFRKAKTGGALVMTVLVWCGLLSGLLLNDTLAIIGTPLMLQYSRRFGIRPSLFLLSLAFAVTTGCMFSPLGSPQSLLIAVEGGIAEPFGVFLLYLGPPAIAGLILAFFFLRWRYPGEMSKPITPLPAEEASDPGLAVLVRISAGILICLIIVNGIYGVLHPGSGLPLYLVAFLSILPVLVFSGRRLEILKGTDWCTLVFFASLFIVMAAVWSTGIIQALFSSGTSASVPLVMVTSLVVSQFISNVPFVALMLPLVSGTLSSVPVLMALAAGSTLAGNATIMGAASNIIIIQGAEREGETLSFFEFMRVGLPLTVAQSVVCLLWFRVLGMAGFA